MKKSISVCILLTVFVTVIAHEYILLTAKYRLHKGDTIEGHLFVADGFNIQLERPFQKSITKSFELITKEGVTDLSTAENSALPIINRKVDFEGGGLLHLERDYARISLTTPKFLDYLKEDHLEGIADKIDPKKSEQKERYTRYIKCLLQSEDSWEDTLYKKVIGQTFEIVLLQNPYRLKPGNVLKAKIIFMGKPLANKVITARSRTGSQAPAALMSRTDGQGICSFLIKTKGEWFLHATHMISCADKTDSDWESFWVSYSFQVD